MTGALFCLMITQSIKRFEKVWKSLKKVRNKDSFAVEQISIVCCRDMVALLSKRYWTFISFFYVLTCITLPSSIYPLPAMHSLLVTSDARNIIHSAEICPSIHIFIRKHKPPHKLGLGPSAEKDGAETSALKFLSPIFIRQSGFGTLVFALFLRFWRSGFGARDKLVSNLLTSVYSSKRMMDFLLTFL